MKHIRILLIIILSISLTIINLNYAYSFAEEGSYYYFIADPDVINYSHGDTCYYEDSKIISKPTDNKYCLFNINTPATDSYKIEILINSSFNDSYERIDIYLSNNISSDSFTGISVMKNKTNVIHDNEILSTKSKLDHTKANKISFICLADGLYYSTEIYVNDQLLYTTQHNEPIRLYQRLYIVSDDYSSFSVLQNQEEQIENPEDDLIEDPEEDPNEDPDEEIIQDDQDESPDEDIKQEEEIIEEEIIEEEIIEEEEDSEPIEEDEEVISDDNPEDNVIISDPEEVSEEETEIIESEEDNIVIIAPTEQLENINVNNEEEKSYIYIPLGLLLGALIIGLLWFAHKTKTID